MLAFNIKKMKLATTYIIEQMSSYSKDSFSCTTHTLFPFLS